MKRLILFFAIMTVCLSVRAYDLPEGSKLLYKGEQRYENYGMYWHQFIVYELNGKTYLVRLQSFSGAAEIVTDADGIARNAPKVKMELDSKQILKLREAIKKADFIEKIQAYNDELEEYKKAQEAQREAEKKENMIITEKGDTIYRLVQERKTLHYHEPTMWSINVEWPGVANGVKSFGSFYKDEPAPKTWTKGDRLARKALTDAIYEVDDLLNEWAYNYKLKNSDRDEMYLYSFTISGGMMQRMAADGHIMRQGRKISLEEKNEQWYVTGYIDEKEDTAKVSDEVARKVEKMCNKLNYKATNPTLKDGEDLVKVEATDDPYWEVRVGYRTKDNINIGEGVHTFIESPKHAAKAYNKLNADIDAINKYLWGFLKLQ